MSCPVARPVGLREASRLGCVTGTLAGTCVARHNALAGVRG